MAEKAFVIREIGGDDRKAFAVVTHGEAWTGLKGYKRKVLFVQSWHEKEHDARAFAHSHNHPDYGA